MVVDGKDKVRIERGVDQSEQVTLWSLTFFRCVKSDVIGLWCLNLRSVGRMSNGVVVSSNISPPIQQDTGLIEFFSEGGVESAVMPWSE